MNPSTDTLGRAPIFKPEAFNPADIGEPDKSKKWMGIHLIKAPPKPVEEMTQQESHEQRKANILALHKQGKTRDQIAIELGLTRDYVRDCINRAGISRKPDKGDKDAAVAAFRAFCKEKRIKAPDIRPNRSLNNVERAANAALRIECIKRVYMASRCPPTVLAQILNLTRANVQTHVTECRREMAAKGGT